MNENVQNVIEHDYYLFRSLTGNKWNSLSVRIGKSNGSYTTSLTEIWQTL